MLPDYQLADGNVVHLIDYHIPPTGSFTASSIFKYSTDWYLKVLEEFENTEHGRFVADHAATNYQLHAYLEPHTYDFKFKFTVKIPEIYHNWMMLKWH